MADTRYEIIIQLPDTGELRYLDTYKYEPISLTYNVADIQDISKRNSSFSRTITLPETKNNRDVFSNISNLAADSTFDPNLKAKAYILVDTVTVFEGNLQLKSIKLSDKLENQYEVVIYADNDTFFSQLGEKYLEDLDFSDLNHIWNADNIRNSWFNNWESGYFYPLIDYGQGWIKTNVNGADISTDELRITNQVNISEMFPATYVKTIWNKIFLEAGYEYQSDFLNSQEFQNLLIPYNGKLLSNGEDFAEDKIFRVGLNYGILPPYTVTQISVTASTGFDWYDTLPVNIKTWVQSSNEYYSILYLYAWNGAWFDLIYNDENSPNGDPNNLWNTSTFTYTNVYPAIVQQFKFYFDLTFIRAGLSFGQAGAILTAFREFNPDGTLNSDWASGWGYPVNEIAFDDSFMVFLEDYGSQFVDTQVTFSTNANGTIVQNDIGSTRVKIEYTMPALNDLTYTTGMCPLRAGEKIRFKVLFFCENLPAPYLVNDSYMFNDVDSSVYPGALIDYTEQVPKKIKQKDFITSIIKMFNLYIEPSKDKKNTFLIEPRDSYYAQGVIKDWTSKIDLNVDINEQILADIQNKQILFTYKDDKDRLNQLYKDTFQEIYGQYLHSSSNEFTKNTQTIQPIFSPTPLSPIPDTSNFVIPRIVKDEANVNAPAASSIDHNIRIVQRGSFMQINPYAGYDGECLTLAEAPENQSYIDLDSPDLDLLGVGVLIVPENGESYLITSIQNLGSGNYRVFLNVPIVALISIGSIVKFKLPQESGLLTFDNPYDRFGFEGYQVQCGFNWAYPYVGHYDNPYQPTYDINFGQLKEQYFINSYTTANNLVNNYWLQFLEETTSKDSRIITVEMYLSPVDIYNFRFNDSIYLFFNESGHYYRVNKISNYDPGQIKTCTVELIKAQVKPIVKQDLKKISRLQSKLNGLATNILLPSVINSLDPTGSGNSPGDVITNGYVGTGIKNTVKGSNHFINGNFNLIKGDNQITNGDSNYIYNDSKSTIVNGFDNISSSDGESLIINGASNSISKTNNNVLINGDNNILRVEQSIFSYTGTSSGTQSGGNQYWLLYGNYDFAATSSNIAIFEGTMSYTGQLILTTPFDGNVTTIQVSGYETSLVSNGIIGQFGLVLDGYSTLGLSNVDVFINGQNNFIHGSSSNLNINGNGNDIGTASSNINVFGNSNTILPNLSDVYVIGNNITITSSNVAYIDYDVVFGGGASQNLQSVLDTGNTATSNGVFIQTGFSPSPGWFYMNDDYVFISSGGGSTYMQVSPDLVTLQAASNGQMIEITPDEVQINGVGNYTGTAQTNAGNSYLAVIDLFTLTSGQSARVKIKVIGVQSGADAQYSEITGIYTYDGTMAVDEDDLTIGNVIGTVDLFFSGAVAKCRFVTTLITADWTYDIEYRIV
jgi:hypothetical protein